VKARWNQAGPASEKDLKPQYQQNQRRAAGNNNLLSYPVLQAPKAG
jgi:hypothetical protein